jgi:hypothetical protein
MAEIGRLLVLAGAALTDLKELPPSIERLLDAADEVFVVTPALTSRIEWVVSDVDRARHAADERLDAILGQLQAIDVPAGGTVGDDSPLDAVADYVRDFAPDHILIALRSGEHSGWQERGLVDRVQGIAQRPITVFEIDASGHAVDRSVTDT